MYMIVIRIQISSKKNFVTREAMNYQEWMTFVFRRKIQILSVKHFLSKCFMLWNFTIFKMTKIIDDSLNACDASLFRQRRYLIKKILGKLEYTFNDENTELLFSQFL